ncbi:MAG TPA: hypothetical protein VMF65_02085 [Acidimicrobiales bacterium]|nr:hypothetical protein [Acidimicrobiales bacterium]
MLPTEAMAQQSGEDRDCLVTLRDRDFVDRLAPGDVLLFDSSFPTSALIKFADNSPINHCAIYIGDDYFAHVTHHLKGEPTVQEVKIYERLDERCDYSVTALHYGPAPGNPDAAAIAIANSEKLRHEVEEYAYLSLLALVFPAFVRSYGWMARAIKPLASGLDVMSRAFLRSMGEEAVTLDFSSELAGRKSVTCSEFVYRCFSENSSPYPVAVINPLCRWKRPRQFRSGGLDEDLGIDVFDLEFNPLFAESPHEDMPSAQALRGDPSLTDEIKQASVELMKDLCRYNVKKDRTRPPEAGVVASFVTPVDLWSSPSFSARAVLVRRPGEIAATIPQHGPTRARTDD